MKTTPTTRRPTGETSSWDLDQLFNRFWNRGEPPFARHLPEVFQRRTFPPVNVAETEDAYTVTVECPGMSRKEIDVQLLGNNLTVRGERKWEEEQEKKEYHVFESQFGHFERLVNLPQDARLDPEAITARYDKGVLTIDIPKLTKTPSSKIEIKA